MPESILFFDTETTGLPNFKSPLNSPQQPSILQIGALLYSADRASDKWVLADQMSTLVQIGSKPIHPKALEAHGISAERANSEGVPQHEAFTEFHKLATQADFLVCHNFSFDFFLIKLMAHQIGDDDVVEMFEEIADLPYKCTMRSTIQFCGLPFPSGRKGCKFPKLEELHQILFNETFDGAHDALIDVNATARCYFELVAREVM